MPLSKILVAESGNGQTSDIFMVIVNNIGIRPSGAIATSMLEKTAEMFEETYPNAVHDLKNLSYVDDVGVGEENIEKLRVKTCQIDEILEAGGMKCKGWVYSHEPGDMVEFGAESEEEDQTDFTEKVLCLLYTSPSPRDS